MSDVMTGVNTSLRVLRLAAGLGACLMLAACATQPTTAGDPDRPQTEKDKRVGQSLVDAARESERKGDFANAANYYRSAYNREPDNAVVIVGMSRSLRKLNRAAEAEAILDRAMKQAERDPELLAEMGKVQVALGKPLEAIESLSRAVSLGATRWDVETALAVAYDRIGMFDKAQRQYDRALEQNPGNAVVLNNFALSRAQAGDLGSAVGLLERAVALPESTSRMRQNLALLYAIQGDLAAAEALVARDLTKDDAAANMEYYRRLRRSVAQEGGPPRLPDLGSTLAGGPNVGSVVGDPPQPENGSTTMPATPADRAVTAQAVPSPAPTGQQAVDANTRVEPTTSTVAAAKPETSGDPWRNVASPKASDADLKPEEPAPSSASTPSASAAGAVDKPTEPDEPASTQAPATPQPPADTPSTSPAATSAPKMMEPDAPAISSRPPSLVPSSPAASKPSATAPLATPKAEPTPPAATSAAPQPSAPAPTTVAAVNAPDGRFALQLGSFKTRARAEARAAQLGQDVGDVLGSLDVSVVEATVEGKGTFYRVVAGRIAAFRQGQALCENLQGRDVGCLVIRPR